MSREGGSAGSGRRERTSRVASRPFPPQFYPVAGYQGTPHAWFPPHPSTGVPGQWNPSWRPPMGYPTPTPPWSPQQTSSPTIDSTTVATAPSDEYTVDTLRRIYKDDDGRVEIQRVKVQRRQPETGSVVLTGPEAMSVVPAGSIPLNERRPPPRRNRRKPEIHMAAMGPAGPYPWYPYMPYMPYPYPYPYYFPGCVWPPGAPPDSVSTWSGNDESEAVSSHQDSALNSQRLESRASLSSPLHRSSSPAAASHITDGHSIAPSDSVSVRGRKRETSLERALRGPTPPPRTKSRASSSLGGKSDNAGKTQEWMLEMQRALRTRGDAATKVSDKGTLRSDHTDVYKKIPPIRKRRKMRRDDMSDKSSLTDLKDADDVSEQQSVVSDATFDESSRISSELNYAFRKLERSVDAFKTEIAADPSPLQSQAASPSVEIFQSSGDATPIEARGTPLPLSDIHGLAEKAKEEEIKTRETYGRPRATSESISSHPSLDTARVGSAPDVSLHSRVTDVSPSQLTTSAETNTVAVTPTIPQAAASTTSTAQVTTSSSTETGSTVTTEVGIKPEADKEASIKPSTSVETEQTCSTDVSHSPKTPSALAGHPSSPVQSSQGHLSATTALLTTQETENGITKVPAEHCIPPAVGRIGAPSNKSTNDSIPVTCAATAPIGSEGAGEASGRYSQASSVTTFFSARTADDSHALDTDSTDIPLPTTDSATADENEESPGSPGPEVDQSWVLQRPEEAPTLNITGQDERRNAWRAEVSLWRARLVVSLCRGRGLDRQDWATFHLMVHHPLTMDLKLSLLHAPRLCVANSSVGPAVLRVALIQLAQHGEILLQPEASRQSGWRCIRLDAGHAWTTVKGATEILCSLGYQERRNSMEMRYKRRCSPEASVVARLTLDMLVLAEELRLFLTGTHQYPNNVSSLFFSESLTTSAIPDLPQRPPSSEGSFVSAQSETIPGARPQSEASSVTDEDTETLQTCATETNTRSKLTRNKSTSDEDVTLREDNDKTTAADTIPADIEELKTETIRQLVSETNANTPSEEQQLPAPDSTSLSSDVTSLPDLQSMHSNTVTPVSQRPSGSELSSGNETITPTATPAVTPEISSFSKAGEANPSTPTPTTRANHDNPEEHVYEEIDVIRAQVESLRASSVPAESAPPPLPPKKKISSGGEDDSGLSLTYPHMEWSSASTPASLRGGSTGARRKKRRAPMPPEFLPQNWKERQETPRREDLEVAAKTQECKEADASKKGEYRRSLNPFYEEIDYLEDTAKETEINKDVPHEDIQDNTENGNPFLGNVKATGYIGKNPFYDDVEILKKSEEYNEMKTKQPSTEAPMDELPPTVGTTPEQPSDPPVVRPKRRAPRPPPTPEAQDARAASRPEDSTSPQQSEDKHVDSNVFQVPVGSVGTDEDSKQASQRSFDQNKIESSVKNTSEIEIETELATTPALNNDINKNMVEKDSSVPLLLGSDHQNRTAEATGLAIPKQSRASRASPSHPKAPPPPPPILAKSSANSPSTDNSARVLKEDSPPPIPPPKAPLSLLDEIPYMDANEVKEAQAQRQSSDPHPVVVASGSPTATLKFSNDEDLPPHCPPPPPPCPPPESPPETPHTSPPETPHVSPPETPHTSPPETPHASPPPTPRLSPKHSSLPPHPVPQDPLVTTEKDFVHEKDDVTGKDEDEAPPVPPKITQLETLDGEAPTPPPSLPISTKGSQQEHTPHPPHPKKASPAVHAPVTETHSVQSSTSEERYEIPDTSRAPPPRPPVPMPPKMQQQQSNGKTSAQRGEYDRYEVPEAPEHPVTGALKEKVETLKAPEAEERYEIPEVVKEQPLKRGVNGAPCSVALGRTSSPRRGEIAAIFGPPKPPRRRRNNHSPPPRPPKNHDLIDGSRPDGLSEAAPRPSSATSSFTSSSSGPQPASVHHKKAPKRRSWPFLLCDCLYVNCRTYEDADK